MTVTLTGATLMAAVSWRDAPEFVTLFAPSARAGAYTAAVSPSGLDAVLREVAEDPAALAPPGAWTPQRLPPADAFGRWGTANRWALARLYGSRQPDVARGPRQANGRVVESWTLISPYPAADFTRLEPGTLRIVLRIAP